MPELSWDWWAADLPPPSVEHLPFHAQELSPPQYCLLSQDRWNAAYLKQVFACQGFFQQIWEKTPGQNWEKMIDLTSKLGEINHIEHKKGSKIYPQNQVILDCIMPSIPLKHKRLCIILIWAIVSQKYKWFLKKVKKKNAE